MSSFRARLIKTILQNRHLLQFKLKEEKVDWLKNESVLNFRQQVEKGASIMGKVPGDINIQPVNINGLYAEWLMPADAAKNKVILYFHGGGYISGTCSAHQAITAKFVKGTGIGALLFEYRLAPENPHPAALEDALKAYKWLLEQGIDSKQIIFVGDSAGGGLCLAALLALRDQGIDLPVAGVAYSPVTDLKCTGETYKTKARVCLSPEGMSEAIAQHYAGDLDPALPYISPLYGDLHGLPPLLIYAGEDETLCDDAVRFADKARKAGTEVTLKVGESMFHCYPAMAPLFPEATEALADICTFIKNKLG